MKRAFLVSALMLALVIPLAGCGSLTRVAATGYVARHSHGHNAAVWCAYHVYRTQADLRRGHAFWAAYQAQRAAHHCRRAH